MPKYDYDCRYCAERFEVKKLMSEASRNERCPRCGREASRRYLPLPFTFGFRLSDESMWVKGHKDEFVRDV